jgi:hypothetical protein
MIMKRYKQAIIGVVALLSALGVSGHASAVELPDISVTLSPSRTQLELPAGTTYKGMLTIINSGASAYGFTVYTAPYSMSVETYDQPDFLTKKPRSDLHEWLTIEKKQFNLKSGETTTVPYTLELPRNASPGGHYGAVFIEVLPTQKEQEEIATGNRIDRKKRLGTIFYTTVQGAVTRKGQIGASIVPLWQYAPPLIAERRVKNIGNTDFMINYSMTVKDVFGRQKFSETKEFPILPQTTRKVKLEWSKSVWYGLYKVETKTSFLTEQYRTENYVLLLPIWMAFILVVIIFGGLYAAAHHYRHR